MKVKIVTDSTADLPPLLAQQLGITVVPAYVRFGNTVYRDRVDINDDEFYRKLMDESVVPTTAPPTPQDFATVYHNLAKDADGIISIHISSKLSATVNSAIKGKKLADEKIPIEIIDSQQVTMGVGLLAILSSTLAAEGKELTDVVNEVGTAIPKIRILGYLDTLRYLSKGGRLNKTKALLSSLARVKPMLTLKNGEIETSSYVRSRFKGIERLNQFINNTASISELAIVYSTTPDDATQVAKQASHLVPSDRIRIARLGPAVGVHSGPGIIFIVVRLSVS